MKRPHSKKNSYSFFAIKGKNGSYLVKTGFGPRLDNRSSRIDIVLPHVIKFRDFAEADDFRKHPRMDKLFIKEIEGAKISEITVVQEIRAKEVSE